MTWVCLVILVGWIVALGVSIWLEEGTKCKR